MQAHDLVQENSPQHDLIDVGASPSGSMAAKAGSVAAKAGMYRKSVTVSLGHAVKHKGGISTVFSSGGAARRDSMGGEDNAEGGAAAYDVALERFKRQQAGLKVRVGAN